MDTTTLFKPTSIKINNASIVVIISETLVIICAPLIPIFRPKNPEIIDANNGNIVIIKYIYFFSYLIYNL